jgi:hypothetical protein
LFKICLIGVLFFSLGSTYGQPQGLRTVDSLTNVNQFDSLLSLCGKNKKFNGQDTLACLIALSHYPELSNQKVKFKEGHIKTTLNTRPTLFSTIFNKKSNRKYVIRVNNSQKPDKVLIEHADFNSKVGLIGHELAHIFDYGRKDAWGVFARGLQYLSKKGKKKFEHEIDLKTIEKGLGWELYDWAYFVLYESCATEKYKKYKRETYWTPEEILEEMKRTGLYKNILIGMK